MKLLQKTDEEILKIVTPIMDNLMEGSTQINHAKHTKDFSTRIKNHISVDALDKMCKEYQSTKGFFTKRDFVSLFKREDSIAVIWKQNFSLIKGDFVAEAVFIEEDERLVVDHVFIF